MHVNTSYSVSSLESCSPLKTWTGEEALRKSYRWTLWSADPTAISCAVLGLYFTQHTLARSSMVEVGCACLVDQACTQHAIAAMRSSIDFPSHPCLPSEEDAIKCKDDAGACHSASSLFEGWPK